MREHKAFKTILLPVFLVVIGFVSGVLFIKYTAPTQDKVEASNEEQSSGEKEPEKITDEYKHYIIDQNLAEDTCTNEDLIFSKISRDTYDMSSSNVVGYDYSILDGSFDKDGNIMVSLTWYGHNKITDLDTPFTCVVSANKAKKVTIHYLGIEDNIIAGAAGYKVYRDDGKEKFTSRYRN